MFELCLPEIANPLKSNSTRQQTMHLLMHAKNSLTLGELALVCSHRRVLETIVNDSSIKEEDFSLVLEDDAKLHPKAVEPHCLVKRAITMSRESNGYGFIYFGFKASRGSYFGCRSKPPEDTDQRIAADCNGHGTHAYAITKRRARTFLSEVYRLSNIKSSGGVDFLQIDQVFNRHFKAKYNRKCRWSNSTSPLWPSQSENAEGGRALNEITNKLKIDLRSRRLSGTQTDEYQPLCSPNFAVGFNLVSPESPRVGPVHKGLIYQFNMTRASRSKGTSLKTKNRFLDVSCFSFHSSRASLSQLLFVYAAAVGLCQKKWFEISSCVSLHVHAENGTDRLNAFRALFRGNTRTDRNDSGLPLANCTSTGSSFQEHTKFPLMVRYDPAIQGVTTGSQLYGNFRSPKYFYPHAKDVLWDLLQFNSELDQAALSYFESIPHRISDVLLKKLQKNKTNSKFVKENDARDLEKNMKSRPSQLLCVSVDRSDSIIKQPNWPNSAEYFRSTILKMYDFTITENSSAATAATNDGNTETTLSTNYFVLIFVGDGEAIVSGRPITSSFNYVNLTGPQPSQSQMRPAGEEDVVAGAGQRFEYERSWVLREIIDHTTMQRENLFLVQDSDIDPEGALNSNPALRLKVFSLCNQFVISVDAFGWWGAYFATERQKGEQKATNNEETKVEQIKVLVPSIGQRTYINPDEYYLKSWQQLKKDTKIF